MCEQGDTVAMDVMIPARLSRTGETRIKTVDVDRCLAPMRKFGIKYARMHPQHEAVRQAFVTARAAGAWQEVLNDWYAEDLPGIHPPVEEANPLATTQ